jgi:hypothetical protein
MAFEQQGRSGLVQGNLHYQPEYVRKVRKVNRLHHPSYVAHSLTMEIQSRTQWDFARKDGRNRQTESIRLDLSSPCLLQFSFISMVTISR